MIRSRTPEPSAIVRAERPSPSIDRNAHALDLELRLARIETVDLFAEE